MSIVCVCLFFIYARLQMTSSVLFRGETEKGGGKPYQRETVGSRGLLAVLNTQRRQSTGLGWELHGFKKKKEKDSPVLLSVMEEVELCPPTPIVKHAFFACFQYCILFFPEKKKKLCVCVCGCFHVM